MHEFILVLRKGDVGRTVGLNEKKCFLRLMKWQQDCKLYLAYRSRSPGYIEHPCPFPEEIPYRLMRLYVYEGDVVLDPFNGSGQTRKLPFIFSGHCIGVDFLKEIC